MSRVTFTVVETIVNLRSIPFVPGDFRQKLMFRFLNFWPPYLGSGVKVRHMDFVKHRIEVELGLSFWNKNYVGTQFGGSLYAMCDPFFMLLLIEGLGPDYIVWDKSARISFLKPGKSRVWARFEIPANVIDGIRTQLKTEYKVEPEFKVDVFDVDNQVIARVEKTLYVRRKDAVRPERAGAKAAAPGKLERK